MAAADPHTERPLENSRRIRAVSGDSLQQEGSVKDGGSKEQGMRARDVIMGVSGRRRRRRVCVRKKASEDIRT